MISIMTGRGGVLVAASVALLAGAAAPAAQVKPLAARFSATTVNMDPSGEPLKIDILRWSERAERESLLAAFGQGDEPLLKALQDAPTIGYIWTSGSLGYALRFAHRIALPDGGERILLATDRRLGAWDRRPWAAAGTAPPADYAFTLIELRLNRDGQGEGKMSLAARISADEATKSLTLSDYEATPVLLSTVKREAGSTD